MKKRIASFALAAVAALTAVLPARAATFGLEPYALASSVAYGDPYSYRTVHSVVTRVPSIELTASTKKKSETLWIRSAAWGFKNEIQFAKDAKFKKNVRNFTTNLNPNFVLEKVESSRT